MLFRMLDLPLRTDCCMNQELRLVSIFRKYGTFKSYLLNTAFNIDSKNCTDVLRLLAFSALQMDDDDDDDDAVFFLQNMKFISWSITCFI